MCSVGSPCSPAPTAPRTRRSSSCATRSSCSTPGQGTEAVLGRPGVAGRAGAVAAPQPPPPAAPDRLPADPAALAASLVRGCGPSRVGLRIGRGTIRAGGLLEILRTDLISGIRAAMTSTGTRLRFASNSPLIGCRLPGPQLAAHTSSSPGSAAFGGCRVRRGLLVADALPGNAARPAHRITEPVQRVTRDSVHSAHAGCLAARRSRRSFSVLYFRYFRLGHWQCLVSSAWRQVAGPFRRLP